MHKPSPLHSSPSQHNYGTRIRKNSVLKPSARLRQSSPSPHPVPRRIKPVPVPVAHQPVPPAPDSCVPVFPIPGVMLHPEDASNKVFHAIGRSFLSVDNRAMTIKDLAETTLRYGLMCQNVSAASQAITTYIRNHMARCEVQQDHPLLLRHVLSGTLADDDLIPALHSRMGGSTNLSKSSSKDLKANDKSAAQPTSDIPEERLTNFRRGTMVWYLSKAAGVSCPFARAGIRLCEYGKEGRKAAAEYGDELQLLPKKRPNHGETRCGEKRKRIKRERRRDSDGSRGGSSVRRDSHSPAIDSGYGEPGTDSSDDERPPKVKLTLRLRPSLPCVPGRIDNASRSREVVDLSNDEDGSSSEDDNARVDDVDDVQMLPDSPEAPWSLPPYPRKSISVPRYTPTCDERTHSPTCSDQRRAAIDERRRSPSVPWSASPPPDSDHDDFDLDSDVDWDSSSFSIHSPAPALQVKVETTDDLQPFKHDPTDIRGMLDAWEDLDCAPISIVPSVALKPLTADDLRFDPLELWDWEFESNWTGPPEDQQDLPIVKMESDQHGYPVSLPTFASGFPASLCSPSTSTSQHSSSPTSESGMSTFTCHSSSSPLSQSAPRSPSSFPNEINRGGCALAWQDAELLGPDSVHPHEFEDEWTSGVRTHLECNSPAQRASDGAASLSSVEDKEDEVDVACVMTETRRDELRVDSSHCSSATIVVPIVNTCRPCNLDVCATEVEGIPVYQTKLGRAFLLRRIDTDFVNLSTILSHLSLSPPLPLASGCVNVSHLSLSINGIWAPLSVARLYAHGLPIGLKSIFLSDDLVMRFPTALQDFYQKSTSGRLLNHFGPSFNASVSSLDTVNPLYVPQLDHGESAKGAVWAASVECEHVDEPLLAISPSVDDVLATLHRYSSTPAEEIITLPETPLSPTEQEIFHVLCVHPDWEAEDAEAIGDVRNAVVVPKHGPPREQTLRRSRRVADAVAARSRGTPPRTKGLRHS